MAKRLHVSPGVGPGVSPGVGPLRCANDSVLEGPTIPLVEYLPPYGLVEGRHLSVLLGITALELQELVARQHLPRPLLTPGRLGLAWKQSAFREAIQGAGVEHFTRLLGLEPLFRPLLWRDTFTTTDRLFTLGDAPADSVRFASRQEPSRAWVFQRRDLPPPMRDCPPNCLFEVVVLLNGAQLHNARRSFAPLWVLQAEPVRVVAAQKPYWKAQEIAQILNIAPRTFRAYVRDGTFPAPDRVQGKIRLWSAQTVEAALQKGAKRS